MLGIEKAKWSILIIWLNLQFVTKFDAIEIYPMLMAAQRLVPTLSGVS